MLPKGKITLEKDGDGVIGVSADIVYKNIHWAYWPTYYGLEIIYWIYLLNFLVGIFNFLPMFMLDGGFLFTDLAEFYMKRYKVKNASKKAVKAFTYVSIFIVLMIVVNALPYFF